MIAKFNLGSNIALGLGCLAFLGGISASAQGRGGVGTSIGGAVMILGAFAYRSAKARKLGKVKWTVARQIFEVMLLVLIELIVLSQNDLAQRLIEDPVPNVILPLWAIFAYLIMVGKAPIRGIGIGEEA